MSEQNKDNISQFFRKAVQKPKIKYIESDWEKLESRLDAASVTGAAKPNHWKTAFIAAVALLFVSTSLLLYTNSQVNTLTKKTKTDKNNVNATTETSAPALSKNEKQIVEQHEVKSHETNRTDGAVVNSSPLAYNATKNIKSSMSKITSESVEQHLTSFQKNDIVNNGALFQNDNVKGETLSQNDNVNGETLSHNGVPLDNISKTTVLNQPSDGEVISDSLNSDSSSLENKKDPIAKSKTNLADSLAETVKSRPSRWNVMLSVSPDFSTTDLDKFTTPGTAFGIAAYYAINNKFSISAGVVKSSKFYWDSGDEYKPNQAGFWTKKTNGVVPTKIEGSCSVLEIPIGLQYYFISSKKSKLYFASTFSSYIMLKESYQYSFDAPNPGATDSWNAKKTSYSLFSIANLAVGYERSISNRIMIGVSPYFKIPMSGVGSWANVKLYSTGAAFTLRYQFQKKKKPDRLIPAD